jgi:hypothetical protein
MDASYYRDLRIGAPGPTVRAILSHKDYVATRLLMRDGLTGDTPCTAVMYAAAAGRAAGVVLLLQHGASAPSAQGRALHPSRAVVRWSQRTRNV